VRSKPKLTVRRQSESIFSPAVSPVLACLAMIDHATSPSVIKPWPRFFRGSFT
jgi:hypothetical protein